MKSKQTGIIKKIKMKWGIDCIYKKEGNKANLLATGVDKSDLQSLSLLLANLRTYSQISSQK